MARYVRERQMTAAVQDASRGNERVDRVFTVGRVDRHHGVEQSAQDNLDLMLARA